MFASANRLGGRFVSATELDIIMFRTSPFGELVWYLSTHVNTVFLAAYINVSDKGLISVGALFPVYFTLCYIRVFTVTL